MSSQLINYYCITNSFEIKEIDSFELAIAFPDALCVVKEEKSSIEHHGSKFPLYSYIVFDLEANSFSIGKWSIKSINSVKRDWNNSVSDYNCFIRPEAIVVDSLGERRAIRTSKVKCEGLVEIVKEMRSYSPFANWATVDVYQKNEKLQKEVEYLKEQLQKLNGTQRTSV